MRIPSTDDFGSSFIRSSVKAHFSHSPETNPDAHWPGHFRPKKEPFEPLIREKSTSVDPYAEIQAEDFSSQNGIQPSNAGAAVGYINDGDYIRFDHVAFGRGPLAGQIIASSNTAGGTVEFRTGSPEGTLIATAEVTPTGGWRTFAPFAIKVVDPESYADGSVFLGDQTLFLVFKGASGYLLDVDSFTFEPSEVIVEELSLINCPSEPLQVGDTIDLDVLISPANTSNQFVAFASNDGISVDYITGEFTATAPGEVTVTATSFSDGSVFAVCTIIVQEKSTSVDPYAGIQALDFSGQNGIQPSNLGKAVGYINDGDYIRFDHVAFGRGPLAGQIIASSNTAGGTIEFRTGSPEGTLIATAEVTPTGGWRTFAPFAIRVVDPESYSDGSAYLADQTLFLVFKGASGYLLDVDSFTFEPSEVVVEELRFINCPSEPLQVGDTIDLDVLISPTNTSNQFVAFASNDGISVDYITGEFTATAPGEVTVTATSFSDGSVFAVCTIIVQEKSTSVDPYAGIQAKDFSSQNGIQPSNAGAAVGYINDGDYIRFDHVAFGRGPLAGQIIASSNTAGGTIEFRTGSPEGTLIARAEVTPTGGWRTFAPFAIRVVDPESYADGSVFLGDQTLFLVFKGASGYLLDVDSFTFEISTQVSQSKSSENEFLIFPNPADAGTINVSIGSLQPEEVVHVHIYTVDGEKIMSQEIRNSVTQLDINALLPGYYVMFIEGPLVGTQRLFQVK
ncbi:carbohydrate-binding protein [Cyclobacterium xiamenense]|uniref:carbohydrate-binding protein n=1 Tax=Cyclobacterium xiamenense TaxID=1297121 RepID=UPI00138663C5|nr:carbohydrate-binding protein [Cyclobacterium xiamenense]